MDKIILKGYLGSIEKVSHDKTLFNKSNVPLTGSIIGMTIIFMLFSRVASLHYPECQYYCCPVLEWNNIIQLKKSWDVENITFCYNSIVHGMTSLAYSADVDEKERRELTLEISKLTWQWFPLIILPSRRRLRWIIYQLYTVSILGNQWT